MNRLDFCQNRKSADFADSDANRESNRIDRWTDESLDYGHKIVVDAYEVIQRVATNSFRVKSILSGENSIVPGDHLQKVRLTRDKLIQLARELKRVTVSNRQI